jgi:MFS family permease
VKWRSPIAVVGYGCLIAVIGFGARFGLGFMLAPVSAARGWGRDVFSLALALQMLFWGLAQPLTGALADRYGPPLVLSFGAIVYALGLATMAYATTPMMLCLTAGVLIGVGLAGSSFTIVSGAFGKLMPPAWRSLAFGAGSAGGSFGQFLFAPLSVALISAYGWQSTLAVFAALVLLMVPLSAPLAVPPSPPAVSRQQSLMQALTEAFGHRSFVLLMLGYFTCGFQTFFIGVHFPAYLMDRGLPAEIGGWALALIGLFNIVGSIGSGWLGDLMPKRFILTGIYLARSAAIALYITLPPSPAATLLFAAVMGLLWLSTIPPTSSLVAIMFGPRWLAMLLGVSFLGHQFGGFLGVWLGGLLFDMTGSYDTVWWIAILLGLVSALINLPIVEKPVHRIAAAPA